jgi:hypothetical protein
VVQVEPAGDQGVQVDLTAGNQVNGGRPGVGVAEDAGHVDLQVLDVFDRQGHL